MWAAYYQADGEMRFTVGVKKHKHQADYELEKFIERMTHPEAVLWWAWVEEMKNDDAVPQD